MEKFAIDVYVPEAEAQPVRPLESPGSFFLDDEERPRGLRRLKAQPVDPFPELAPACREHAAQIELPLLGRGSEKALRRRIESALTWARRHYDPEQGSFWIFAHVVVEAAQKSFFTRITARRRKEELDDQNVRDQLGVAGDKGLEQYVVNVEKQLRAKLGYRRFRVPSERQEDLVADTVLKIVELVRRGSPPFPFAKYEVAGVPAYVALFDEVRAAARKNQRLTVVTRPIDLPDGSFPSAEEMLLEAERRQALKALPGKLAERLSATQRRWLDAFLVAAAEDGDLNLALAASRSGLHRAQAVRAAAHIAAAGKRYKLFADLIEPRSEMPKARESEPIPLPAMSESSFQAPAPGKHTTGTPQQDDAVITFQNETPACEHDRERLDLRCPQCRHEAAEIGRYRNRKKLDKDFCRTSRRRRA